MIAYYSAWSDRNTPSTLRKSPYTESTSGGGASTSYHGDSDLQLERINVYCNEATDELLEKPLYRKHFWRRRLRFGDKVAKVVVRSSGRALGADKSGNETGGLGGAKVGTEPEDSEEQKWDRPHELTSNLVQLSSTNTVSQA